MRDMDLKIDSALAEMLPEEAEPNNNMREIENPVPETKTRRSRK